MSRCLPALLAALLLPGAADPAPAQAAGAPTPAPAAAATAIVSVYRVEDPAMRLALRDVNGDKRRDLISVALDGIGLRLMREDGSFPDADDGHLQWPTATVGWNLADLDGNGTTEIVLIVDGTRVVVVRPDEHGALAAGPDLITEPKGFLPRGVRRVNCVRDVDGDGRLDLVVPGTSRFLIHLQTADGWAPALPVSFQARISLELGDPGRLDGRFAQDVQIPWFTLQDVDGDGRTDLVSETGDEALFHLAAPALPDQPSWRLDLAALRSAVSTPERIDLDNLLANVEPQVNWKTADVDGQPPHDLVIQQGGTFEVYLGGSHGPDLVHPDQVLKASGNVLYFLLRDVDKDGRPDLQILRAQTISLADALRLLVVPGSLDFDVFTYANLGADAATAAAAEGSAEAGPFSRKPTTRASVSLRIPALLGFLDKIDDMKADYEKRLAIPAQPAALDDDGLANDIVDIRVDEAAASGDADTGPGKLAIWKDRVPGEFTPAIRERLKKFDVDGLLEEYATQRLDQLDDGGTVSIGLEDIQKLLVTPGYDLREARKGRPADREFPLAFQPKGASLRVEDLDGDGRSDVVAIGRDADKTQLVQIFVMR